MPFITQERRKIIDQSGIYGLDDIQPGDRCYPEYRKFVDAWKAQPRWTTAHSLYKQLLVNRQHCDSLDSKAALDLAWQVFFQLHVMPYELMKRKENGDI